MTRFKEAKIIILYWSLYSQFLESLKSVIFNLKFFSLVFLISAPRTPVSIVLLNDATYNLMINKQSKVIKLQENLIKTSI
jgi:hypothetical protein